MKKNAELVRLLKSYNKVLVAFSGGIDSTVVLDTALKTLGKKNVVAVVANSDLFTDEEYAKAIHLAQELGATVKGVTLDYLANDEIKFNRPSSWYWMKKLFYQKMNDLKAQYDCDVVLDGMIMDDNDDFRPGLRAVMKKGPFQFYNWLTSTSRMSGQLPGQMGYLIGIRLQVARFHLDLLTIPN